MADPKLLTESGWKIVVSKNKIKDNGLMKALATYDKLEDDDHEACLKTISSICQLANTLKKSKEVAAVPDVLKYLTNLLSTADWEENQVTKAQAEAEKLEAANQKKAQDAQAKHEQEHGEDEDEDPNMDFFAKLKKTFAGIPTAKVPHYFMVCDAKPYALIVSKKDIRKSAQHRKQLSLLAGGVTRPPKIGMVRFEAGKMVFEIEDDEAPGGFARIISKWIKESIGVGYKVMFGNQSSDEEDVPLDAKNPDASESPENAAKPTLEDAKAPPQAAPPGGAGAVAGTPSSRSAALGGVSLKGSVGRGGKNKPEDVTIVQESLNRRVNAGLKVDGKYGPKTLKAIETFQKNLGQFKPDGLVEPGRGTARALAGTGKLPPPPPPPKTIAPPKLPKPTLASAPLVWEGTRDILDKNIQALKKGVLGQYGNEHSGLIKEIDENLVKLDVIIDKLDKRLADSLKAANAAKDDAARKAELKNSKIILADYIKFVKAEPLINHIDSNPFGVDTKLKTIITNSLTHMAQAIG